MGHGEVVGRYRHCESGFQPLSVSQSINTDEYEYIDYWPDKMSMLKRRRNEGVVTACCDSSCGESTAVCAPIGQSCGALVDKM